MCSHVQKLLALDFWMRPTVTDAYELIYFNLYYLMISAGQLWTPFIEIKRPL